MRLQGKQRKSSVFLNLLRNRDEPRWKLGPLKRQRCQDARQESLRCYPSPLQHEHASLPFSEPWLAESGHHRTRRLAVRNYTGAISENSKEQEVGLLLSYVLDGNVHAVLTVSWRMTTYIVKLLRRPRDIQLSSLTGDRYTTKFRKSCRLSVAYHPWEIYWDRYRKWRCIPQCFPWRQLQHRLNSLQIRSQIRRQVLFSADW